MTANALSYDIVKSSFNFNLLQQGFQANPLARTNSTAIYCRLSKDDGKMTESNSISSQKEMLRQYAQEQGFSIFDCYIDDGISGTVFTRPNLQRMLADAESGRINCIVTKDLSRFRRDYLKVRLYTEILFAEKDVRMIAINDNVDTLWGDDDFLPFRNIMAEWYARDASRKIKSVLNAKGRDGKPLTNSPPFGFLKDPNDKYHWIVDETAAQIVRRIYEMTVDGMGPWLIAQTLCNEQIERPSYYLGKQGLGNKRNTYDTENPYAWRSATVVEILTRPEYCGQAVR